MELVTTKPVTVMGGASSLISSCSTAGSSPALGTKVEFVNGIVYRHQKIEARVLFTSE
jgi:hypothetical protein